MFEITGPQRALALRSMALVVGAVVGAILHPEVTEDESLALYGAIIGMGAGAMNSIIVSILKRKVSAAVGAPELKKGNDNDTAN
jgi:hypothetical protein